MATYSFGMTVGWSSLVFRNGRPRVQSGLWFELGEEDRPKKPLYRQRLALGYHWGPIHDELIRDLMMAYERGTQSV